MYFSIKTKQAKYVFEVEWDEHKQTNCDGRNFNTNLRCVRSESKLYALRRSVKSN